MSNVDIIKSLYQAFEQGDISRVFDVLDPNVEWIESEGIPYGGTFIGHEAVLNGVFQKIGAEWDNFQAHVDEFIDAGITKFLVAMFILGNARLPITPFPLEKYLFCERRRVAACHRLPLQDTTGHRGIY